MIDIIIPIYNAYEELKKCIESVQEYTSVNDARIILIDDASPDSRVKEYIESIEGSNVIKLYNDINRGFSNNINIGFSLSDENDVMLLNSDTIVTRGWIEKIRACAYLRDDIGMVSPLSNSATICSIPNFCEDNDLPEGYTVESFGNLVEAGSLHRYPYLSVCVGFCMYIKRSVIKIVGEFDAETYKRGYGEEGDFCYRARLLGYKCALADDTFIYHSGSASFLPEARRQLAEEHERILIGRYPQLTDENRVFYTSNPIKEIQDNIKMLLILNNGRKNILYLSHRDFADDADDHVGGTQFHIKDLKDNLKSKYNIVVLARDFVKLRLTVYSDDSCVQFAYFVGKASEVPEVSNNVLKSIFDNVLQACNISLVHIHHTKQLSLDMFELAQKRNIPVIFTGHDYYSICPSVKMITGENCYCGCCVDYCKCSDCLCTNKDVEFKVPQFVEYMKIWRENNKAVLAMCDKIVLPSKSAKNIYGKVYPEIIGKCKVIPHGESMPLIPQKGCYTHQQIKEFRVAFVGGLNEAKGSELVAKMIKTPVHGIKWYVFGGTNNETIRSIQRQDYVFNDWYNRDTISSELIRNEIDLVCILPIWPETFCYVLSEAVMAGIPVLATDIGALSERIDELKCGWKIPIGTNAQGVLNKINDIRTGIGEYESIINHISDIPAYTAEDMSKEYEKMYDECINNHQRTENAVNLVNIFESAYNNSKCGNDAEVMRLDRELEQLKNSYGYRLVQYFQVKKWPFKGIARRIIHKKMKR